jgi:hypothetical protein
MFLKRMEEGKIELNFKGTVYIENFRRENIV